MDMQVEIWVCPRCRGYWASSGIDPRGRVNYRSAMRNSATEDPANWGSVIGTRTQCQHCKQQGVDVERIPVQATIAVPESPVASPPCAL